MNRQSRRLACWPLEHHHGHHDPLWLNFLQQKKVLQYWSQVDTNRFGSRNDANDVVEHKGATNKKVGSNESLKQLQIPTIMPDVPDEEDDAIEIKIDPNFYDATEAELVTKKPVRIQNCIKHGYRDGRTQSYWNLLIGICVVQSPFKKFGRSLCILVLTTLQNPDTQI